MKKGVIFAISLISVVLGYALVLLFVKLDVGDMIDFAMDYDGNVYILSYQSSSSKYHVIKSNSNGTIVFDKEIHSFENEINKKYNQLVLDGDSNVYLLENSFSIIDESTNDKELVAEKIIKYNSNGDFDREVAVVDYSSQTNVGDEPYIYKVQVVNEDMRIICKNGEGYEVLSVDLNTIDSPQVLEQFGIIADIDTSTEYGWVTDIAVMSDNRVIYGTKRGEFYVMDDNKMFKNISSVIGTNICVTDFSIDSSDNLYFTEIINRNFYKFNLNDLTIELLYSPNEVVNNKKNLTLEDATYIKCIQSNDFYGFIKGTNNQGFIRFGRSQNLFYKMHYNFFTRELWIIALFSIVIFAFIFGIFFVYKKFFTTTLTLKKKISVITLPVYVLAMIIIAIVSINISIDNYHKVISTAHDVGKSLILDNVDIDAFARLNSPSNYLNEDFSKVQDESYEGFNYAYNKLDGQLNSFIMYRIYNDQLYITFNNFYNQVPYNQSKDINYRLINPPFIPIEYVFDSKNVTMYYNFYKYMVNNSFSNCSYEKTISDSAGKWIASIQPITDSSGLLVGFIEIRTSKSEYYSSFYWAVFSKLISTITISTLAVFAYLIIVLSIFLKPLKKLKEEVNLIGEGNWNNKININSRDEFSQIGRAFNLMTDRMNEYVSELLILNNEYIRFLPVELFHLIGKDRIQDVKLYDNKSSIISILYITFNIKDNKTFADLSKEQFFGIMNKNLDPMLTIIKNNNGVVSWFDGVSLMAFFPYSHQDAVISSLQLKESFTDSILKDTAKIMLNAGDSLIGVMGNKSRMSISVLSSAINQINNISSRVDSLGLTHFAIEPIVNAMGYVKNCKYRLVGQVRDMYSDHPIKIYEFINETNLYEKDLYSVTKGLFESGVEAYIQGKFMIARKAFANVLRVNSEDKVSMHYLVLCDENEGKNFAEWDGCLF